MSKLESEQFDLLDRLADEFAARFRRGERPALEEYTVRYPVLADETLRAVVIEATAEINGTSRADAEARLFFDPAFPADPFVR